MILIVIEVGRVAVQILELIDIFGLASQELRGVKTVVVRTHHLWQTRYQVKASVDGHVNLRGHTLVALCLDDEYAIGTLGTIEGSTILQHLNTLDIVHVQVGQHVVEVAVVQGRAVVLHVHDDIVNND